MTRDVTDRDDELVVTRSEEELRAGTSDEVAGHARARKVVDTTRVAQEVGVGVEHADVERVDVTEEDSGEVETLPDGSVSIPVFEEQLVITKRLVVRERVILRKHTVVENQRVEADLRRERVEIDADDDVADRVIDARAD